MTRFQRPISAFTKGTPVVPRSFLPTHAAMFGNRLQMPVRRSGRRLGGLARHRIRTRWHDDRGLGMTGSDRAVDAVLVVCAIAGERASIIFRPIRHPIPLPGDVMTAGIDPERRADIPVGLWMG